MVNNGTVTTVFGTANLGTFTNAGTINGAVGNFSTFTNSGTVNGFLINSAGTYTQTAGSTNGGITNGATINANAGAFNGAIVNSNGTDGTFNIGGTVTSNSTFGNNTAGARLLVNSGTYTVTGLITNSGTNAAGGILVAVGATLTANGGLTNNSSATIINNGTVSGGLNNSGVVTNNLTWTGTISNSAGGTFNNNAPGTVSGLVSNTGTGTNSGALNGGLLNTAGTFGNTGTIAGVSVSGGTVTNSGIVTVGVGVGSTGTYTQTAGTTSGGLSTNSSSSLVVNANGGAINGGIAANGGNFNIGGNVTTDGVFVTGGTARLNVTGGNFTGITTLANNSNNATGIVVAATRTLSANTIANNGGSTIQNSGILTATSLTNAAGATISNAGTITTTTTVNDGTITGAYTMAAGTLSGIGNTQSLTVNGGTFAPGNGTAGSSMTVTGSLVMQAAATYLVQVNPTTASFTNVTGAASLNGATVSANFAAGSYISKRYTIVTTASGVTSRFGALVTTGQPANMNSSLSYDINNAYIDLKLNFGLPGGTLSQNQQNVGDALTGFFNRTGGIPTAFASLTAAQLTQSDGEYATGSQQSTFNAMNQFLGLMTDPFVAGRGDPVSAGGGTTGYADEQTLAYAAKRNPNDALAAIYRKAPVAADPFAQRWSVWAAGYGGSQTTSGNAVQGSSNSSSNLYGTAVGADYRLSPDTLAGFALAGGGTNFSVANGLGSGRSDLFQAGAFIRHNMGAAYLSGALAYGWQDITTNRTLTIAGIDQLQAKFNANAWSGRIEGGYRFVTQGLGWTPYAAGQFTTFDLPAYAEQAISGANTFALAYGAKSVTATRSELGLRTDKSFAMEDGVFTLRGRAWAHDYNPDRNIGATFQTLPGASFVVNGARQASDAALLTASAEKKWLNGWSAAGTFEGEFSSVTTSYAGKGVVRYSW
ncbi:autotransporter domain-containing protein [Bradyrhizobium sp. KBS0727]|nr:autotransporter domain-containing protein [Bradyrhizobium sp. KBS0725]QDW48580.1 autotransporter domain-containing protein [Bradyrhizobium sp. KBS0727]